MSLFNKNVPKEENSEIITKDNWIWVEGYKAVSYSLKAYDGFQFEVGKLYTAEGDIEECKNGFHLCATPEIISRFKNFGRIFKVRALVPEKKWVDLVKDTSEYRSGEVGNYYSYLYSPSFKIAAKQIELIEELPTSVAFGVFKHSISPFVETEEEYLNFIKEMEEFGNIDNYNFKKFSEGLQREKFSGPLIRALFYDLRSFSWKEMKHIYDYIIGFSTSGVSPDMKIYLIMNEINTLRESKKSKR